MGSPVPVGMAGRRGTLPGGLARPPVARAAPLSARQLPGLNGSPFTFGETSTTGRAARRPRRPRAARLPGKPPSQPDRGSRPTRRLPGPGHLSHHVPLSGPGKRVRIHRRSCHDQYQSAACPRRPARPNAHTRRTAARHDSAGRTSNGAAAGRPARREGPVGAATRGGADRYRPADRTILDRTVPDHGPDRRPQLHRPQ